MCGTTVRQLDDSLALSNVWLWRQGTVLLWRGDIIVVLEWQRTVQAKVKKGKIDRLEFCPQLNADKYVNDKERIERLAVYNGEGKA